MARPPRRDREIVRIREDILQAAAHAFAEKGFHAATMQDIAREAGYTAASLYTYFESKDQIFDALQQLVIREWAASFDEPVPEGLTLRQRLELLLYRQYQLLDRHRDAFTVFLAGIREGRSIGPAKDGPRPAGFFLFVNGLKRYLEASGWEREFPDIRAEDAAFVLAGLHNSFFIRWVAGQEPGKLSDRAGEVISYFFHGVSGADRSPAKKPARS
jgi:AcrR family transcriptional regulator